MEEAEDSLDGDLTCLQRILDNQTLTHDERLREIRALTHLRATFRSPRNAECALQMFKKISQKNWADLFMHFGLEIVYSRFPEHGGSTSRASVTPSSPLSAINPWLTCPDKWAEVLYGTIVSILEGLTAQKVDSHSTLANLDSFFHISEKYAPGLVENVLKRFFIEKAPESIRFFMAVNRLFRATDASLLYFSKDSLYTKVASFLPDNTELRARFLADFFRHQKKFTMSLEYPFVRNNDELCLTAIVLMQTCDDHLLNLFQEIPSPILTDIFSALYRQDAEGFLTLFKSLLASLNASTISGNDYIRLVLMLLSSTEKSHIDVFSIIDATQGKEKLVSQFLMPQSLYDIGDYKGAHKWIFSIIHHYEPERLQHVAAQLIMYHINQNQFGSTLEVDYCLQAILSVTNNAFVWPEIEKVFFTDYVMNRLQTASKDCTSSDAINALAHFIPDADRILVNSLMHTKDARDALSPRDAYYLDDLVRVYGFSHMLALCHTLDLTCCCIYLDMKFSAFPRLLEVTDNIVTACNEVLEAFKPPINEATVRNFFKQLHAAIVESAKNSRLKPFNLDILSIAVKSELPEAVLSLLPDYRNNSCTQSGAALLLTNSWKKSGLIQEAASSSDCSSAASSSLLAAEPF